MENKIDKTIDEICDWIQNELKETNVLQENYVISEMVKALAELIAARARESGF